jgi:hypothetical protein
MAFEPATAANTGPISLSFDSAANDPTIWLPAHAADRLRALRQRSSDLNVVIPAFEERHAASNAKIKAEQRLKRITDHPHQGGFNLKDDDQRVVAARQRVDEPPPLLNGSTTSMKRDQRHGRPRFGRLQRNIYSTRRFRIGTKAAIGPRTCLLPASRAVCYHLSCQRWVKNFRCGGLAI